MRPLYIASEMQRRAKINREKVRLYKEIIIVIFSYYYFRASDLRRNVAVCRTLQAQLLVKLHIHFFET